MSTAFPLLRLPLELREAIYSSYFNPASLLVDGEFGGGQYRFNFDLYLVSKQIHSEAENVFRRENVFVRIETPWPTAGTNPTSNRSHASGSSHSSNGPQSSYGLHHTLDSTPSMLSRRRRYFARVFFNHISQDGLVPIVAAGHSGKLFRRHHQLVEISAPVHQAHPEHVMVVLLDDLEKFCQVWFYSALSYPALNHHLRTTFVLQDPYYPADPKPIPLALQKRLLLPFQQIKGLYQIEIDGFDEGVKQELEKLMANPVDSVQKCCEDCADLMAEGDRELGAGDAGKALDLYVQAFRAIHIIIAGRTRRVLGDPFFHDGIEAGRFANQSGTTVRIILRIKLVSRTVNAYLKLQQWEEAAFWGMRSIRIMREAMESEFEDFLMEFVGAEDVGLLYLRTAIAMRKMEETGSPELPYYGDGEEGSEQLFPLTKKYLKTGFGKLVKRELEEVGFGDLSDKVVKIERETDKESMMHMNQDSDEEADAESSRDQTLSSFLKEGAM